MKNHGRSQGFTLIELMIVVAIVGILLVVGLPAYQDYVRRGAIQDGVATLSDLRIRLEQFYQNNRHYGNGSCGHDGVAARVGMPGSEHFSYACALTEGDQGYTLTATGKENGSARGHVYTLNEGNQRGTTKFKGEAVTKTCWVIRGSEC